ncbi:MAG: anti-sigma factor family protein [Chthoniobacterales bacterium]
MPNPDRHLKEELQDLLDDRLPGPDRAAVERHLASCPECQREFEALRWTKGFAAEHFSAREVTADLQENIRRALGASRSGDPPNVSRPNVFQTHRRAILAWAAVLVAAALVAAGYFAFRPSLPEVLAQNFSAYEEQDLQLTMETRDVKQMEIYFDEHDVNFKARVFDLGMMNYDLVGGRVQRLRGQNSALFVYRGPGNHPLLCQMYSGKKEDLPAGAVLREHKGITFYRYQIRGLTVVFWPEHGMMCGLVSDIAADKVVALAFAKAGA